MTKNPPAVGCHKNIIKSLCTRPDGIFSQGRIDVQCIVNQKLFQSHIIKADLNNGLYSGENNEISNDINWRKIPQLPQQTNFRPWGCENNTRVHDVITVMPQGSAIKLNLTIISK